MAQKISGKDFGLTPGQIYRGITTVGEDFEGETKLGVEQDPAFVKFCKKMHTRYPGFAKNATFPEKHREAVAFLGWRLSPGDFSAALKGTLVTAGVPAFIIIILVLLFGIGITIGEFDTASLIGGGFLTGLVGGDADISMNLFMGLVFIAIIGIALGEYFIFSFPLSAAEDERNLALTYVPEMVGYMIMSMKLVPNLEKAIEFSAKHGRGKVSTDFKRLIWDFQIGVYTSIAEGLDALAYRWGEYSTELKESLMKIRASVMEPSESQRYQVLDKTMLEVLDSVKGKMEDYARSLNQPSIMLFYLGVLLPLILIIILPVGSAFSGTALAQPLLLVLIYCVGIPAAAFIFAKNVVSKRPPTYEPPQIPNDYPELPKNWGMPLGKGKIDARVVAIGILLLGTFLSFMISSQGFPPKLIMSSSEQEDFMSFQMLRADRSLEQILQDSMMDKEKFGKKVFDFYLVDYYDLKKGSYYIGLVNEGMSPTDAEKLALMELLKFTSSPKNDPSKALFWAGFVITLVIVGSFLLYHKNIYKRKAQLNVIKMEDEFKESMYVIASRMGENKPVESALKQAKDFLPNLLVSQRIFGKTVENIELMGLSLENAIFDPIYGSMKNIPSKTLTTAMRLLVDSVSLGVEVASRTLMSLSLQMENMDKVNKSLKDMVSDVTTTMTTMAIFIGPIVLGITVALQRVVMMTLSSIISSPTISNLNSETNQGIGSVVGSQINTESLFQISVETFNSLASPVVFFLIIAIYVVEIVIIMIYFTTKIQEDNDLLFKVNLAKSLPIAVIIFVITVVVANTAIAALL